ncbi:hypothetical protein GGI23_004200, partial [Coemansia sp. RSA 2559]
MEDLVSRGLVQRIGTFAYRILDDTLSTGRTSITIGAPVGADKRRFNLKWLYDYLWLQFDPETNAMLCALCKRGKRANQFAKKGSRNFKTSALADHSTSNDHQKSLGQFGPLPMESPAPDSLLLICRNSLWMAVAPEHPESLDAEPLTPKDASGQNNADDVDTIARQAVSVEASSTAETITTIASRLTATDGRSDEPLALTQQTQPQQPQRGANDDSTSKTHGRPHSYRRSAGAAAKQNCSNSNELVTSSPPAIGVYRTRSGETGSTSCFDEGYAKEFDHAVQALLQAMNLNMPISSVGDLYRLQVQPTPLADIGSKGYANRMRRGAAAGFGAFNDDLRLAGALTNSTNAARTLQHVVSSEILSLIKDEVSQSPAFSVIIDEAPLREHNSLVAHVLLYLRYLRVDPESSNGSGELQVITRFWRCVHLYHDKNGRLAKRDPTSLAITLLERAKVDCSRLVCISTERSATHEDEESERKRYPQIIHWRGLYTYPNSLSPQVYEEITQRSDDFVSFAMTLMDLCRFMYSHPSSFAFLGVDFQEMLYKTLYEIFLSEGSFSTRLPISLTPSIVVSITRNIAQIMATVLALSNLPSTRTESASTVDANAPKKQSAGVNMPDSSNISIYQPSVAPKSPHSSLQIPLPFVDILVSSFGGPGSQKSVGRCPPADVLLKRLRDYTFLGCLHFMADILALVKPILDIARSSDMPLQAFGQLGDPANHTLDQRLRAYIGMVKDAIESVTLMYGDEEDESSGQNNNNNIGDGSGEEDYAGFHLNEFMQLTNKADTVCQFRTFPILNYSQIESQSQLIELIRTVSSAILHDLHERFNPDDIAAIQALSDMWDPTQFPRRPDQASAFSTAQAHALAHRFSQRPQPNPNAPITSGVKNPGPHNHSLVNPAAVSKEWKAFKEEVCYEAAQKEQVVSPDADPLLFPSGCIQRVYRSKLFPGGTLAPSRRRLRSVEDGMQHREGQEPKSNATGNSTPPSTRFGSLSKLASAWNVLPLATSLDVHLFRRLYERQLSRICREQAENKIQSINFEIGDTFSELIGRLSPNARSGKKITVYDILENSKVKIGQGVDSMDLPLPSEPELSGVTVEYFLRSIDAVTMALDHRVRLLSLGLTESPLAVSRTPGECPKWMQNAMRGYWKLACRPSRSSSIARTPSSHHPYRHARTAHHALGSSVEATSIQSQASADVFDGQGFRYDLSTPITGNTLVVPGMPSAFADGMSAIDFNALTGSRTNVMSGSADSDSTQPSLMISSVASNPYLYQQQVQRRLVGDAASGSVDSLPLLEALLSDPANVPPDSAPPVLTTHLSPLPGSGSGSKRTLSPTMS